MLEAFSPLPCCSNPRPDQLDGFELNVDRLLKDEVDPRTFTLFPCEDAGCSMKRGEKQAHGSSWPGFRSPFSPPPGARRRRWVQGMQSIQVSAKVPHLLIRKVGVPKDGGGQVADAECPA